MPLLAQAQEWERQRAAWAEEQRRQQQQQEQQEAELKRLREMLEQQQSQQQQFQRQQNEHADKGRSDGFPSINPDCSFSFEAHF